MKNSKAKTKSFTITVPGPLAPQLRSSAYESGRTISGMITWLLIKELKAQGFIKGPPRKADYHSIE